MNAFLNFFRGRFTIRSIHQITHIKWQALCVELRVAAHLKQIQAAIRDKEIHSKTNLAPSDQVAYRRRLSAIRVLGLTCVPPATSFLSDHPLFRNLAMMASYRR